MDEKKNTNPKRIQIGTRSCSIAGKSFDAIGFLHSNFFDFVGHGKNFGNKRPGNVRGWADYAGTKVGNLQESALTSHSNIIME